ncbi:hypothetical protein TeGR_g12594 [Tetraparma gracilis]|uniref:Tudor domain-containing protein n=1 Tax=Tetraparma gracilis TaxID=2962635 RepID=A0ABQ6MC37_9STRA|nr:hypothetical protein TeGR_g12594 [Tetraparma gracilis]
MSDPQYVIRTTAKRKSVVQCQGLGCQSKAIENGTPRFYIHRNNFHVHCVSTAAARAIVESGYNVSSVGLSATQTMGWKEVILNKSRKAAPPAKATPWAKKASATAEDSNQEQTTAPASDFVKGETIECLYGSIYHDAVITCVNADGTYDVAYVKGGDQEQNVPAVNLRIPDKARAERVLKRRAAGEAEATQHNKTQKRPPPPAVTPTKASTGGISPKEGEANIFDSDSDEDDHQTQAAAGATQAAAGATQAAAGATQAAGAAGATKEAGVAGQAEVEAQTRAQIARNRANLIQLFSEGSISELTLQAGLKD